MKSMKYVYPAQFVNEDNGAISVYFPDLDGCQTYDDTLEGASVMAISALEGYLSVLLEMGKKVPKPSEINDITCDNGLVMMVVANVMNMSDENKPVKKTLSIPKWLDREAKNAHINYSGVLKEALIERLNLQL
ncbi:MAG: type II toxin-antitoxin system HicB family antitoxin [Oscillospiraceae bacterium]|jgi:predicted RNase H-like HicB family nuclease|nr:type II toxin-antitoxin system HicB family antitoxin [Oscillospiraceae bacterium]